MKNKKEIVNEKEKFTVLLYNKYLEEQGRKEEEKNATQKKMSDV
jgi:hypothetical protein